MSIGKRWMETLIGYAAKNTSYFYLSYKSTNLRISGFMNLIMWCSITFLQARANETYDGIEEGYESSRDEFFSVSSYNPGKENIHSDFWSSLSLQSSIGKSSNQDASYLKERTSISSYTPLAQLSVAEVLYDSVEGKLLLEHPIFHCHVESILIFGHAENLVTFCFELQALPFWVMEVSVIRCFVTSEVYRQGLSKPAAKTLKSRFLRKMI